MAKSALLKSSLAKKYWMALTGLFLCLFLAGHLAGNLQLLFGTPLQFNQYALFMTTNPAVKALSYVTYISILFHAIDGFILTIQNRKARPVRYVKTNPSANSGFASRNMAILGTLILVFIVTHMNNFWAKMHFSEMPLQTITVENPMAGEPMELYYTTNGGYFEKNSVIVKNKTEFYSNQIDLKVGEGYKDLHKITFDFFKHPKFGLIASLGYALAMLVLAFHLWHGFQSAFISMGLNDKRWTPVIKIFGKLFSIIVPVLFAVIPLYIHFLK
ncbi:MAG: succinate dehydrogenase cytochrome b subunit [Flavobacterium sp.]